MLPFPCRVADTRVADTQLFPLTDLQKPPPNKADVIFAMQRFRHKKIYALILVLSYRRFTDAISRCHLPLLPLQNQSKPAANTRCSRAATHITGDWQECPSESPGTPDFGSVFPLPTARLLCPQRPPPFPFQPWGQGRRTFRGRLDTGRVSLGRVGTCAQNANTKLAVGQHLLEFIVIQIDGSRNKLVGENRQSSWAENCR